MNLGNGFWFPDRKDLETPEGSTWVPIIPARLTRPPPGSSNSAVSQSVSSNGMEPAGVFDSIQNTDSFSLGSQCQNGSSHPRGIPERQWSYSNFEALLGSQSQIHHQFQNPTVQTTRNPAAEWNQVPLGKGAAHSYSPFTFNALVGGSQSKSPVLNQMLPNGKIALYPQHFSHNNRTQLSLNGASAANIPNNNTFYSPQAVTVTVDNESSSCPLAPVTPDKWKRVQDGHTSKSIDSQDDGDLFFGKNMPSMNLAGSTLKEPLQICFSQGAAQPATLSYGAFSLLLESQHQKAENKIASPNKTVSAPLAPVTPDKCNTITNAQAMEVISFVDNEDTMGNQQQVNGIDQIEKEYIQIYFDQNASQTDLRSSECFLQQPGNQIQRNLECQGIDLNMTPQQKSRKKKHRPKVIREGKPARKPRQPTPKSAGNFNIENPSGKRKYVRKNVLNVDMPSSTEANNPSGKRKYVHKKGINEDITSTIAVQISSGKRKYVRKKGTNVDTPSTTIEGTSDPDNRSVRRSVKRSLNFDSKVQGKDGFQPPIQASAFDVESREQEGKASNTSHSGAGMDSQALEQMVELARIVNSMDKISGNCSHLRGNSAPDDISSRKEILRENLNFLARERDRLEIQRTLSSRLQGIHQSTPENMFTSNSSSHSSSSANDDAGNIGFKRNFCPSSNAAPQGYHDVTAERFSVRQTYNSKNSVDEYLYSSNDEANQLSVMHTKKRKEGQEMEIISNATQTFPKGLANLNYPLDRAISCAQQLVSLGRMQDAERVLAYIETEKKRMKLYAAQIPTCNQLEPSLSMQRSTSTKGLFEDRSTPETSRNDIPSNIKTMWQQEYKASPCSSNLKSVESTVSQNGTFKGKNAQNIHRIVTKTNRSSKNNQVKLDLSSSFRQMAPDGDPIDLIVHKMKCLIISKGPEDNTIEGFQPQNALIPYHGDGTMVPFVGPLGSSKKRIPRAKVDLDSETNRVWMLLMGKEGNDGAERSGKDKEKWWEEERQVFRGRADSFIARMHLVQGDRRFSRWKGSVVDSVVGVFLTQNVSDHLSSSAFMALAARFPSQSINQHREPSIPKTNSPVEKAVIIVEIEDEVKLQQDTSEHYLPHSSEVFNKIPNTQDKGAKGSKSRSTGNFVFECSKLKDMDVCERDKKLYLASPEYRTDPLTLTHTVIPIETDDTRPLENVPASQNSVLCSQNSSDSPIQMVDRVGQSLESNTDMEGMLSGRWNCLDASTPFMTLLQMAGAGMFHESYTCRSENIVCKENHSCATNALETVGFENKAPEFDHSFGYNDACPSADSEKSHSGDLTDKHVAPSTSHLLATSDSRFIRMESGSVPKRGTMTFFTPSGSEISNTDGIRNSSSISAFGEYQTEVFSQEESVLTSHSSVAVDSHLDACNRPDQQLSFSETEACFPGHMHNYRCMPHELDDSTSNTSTPPRSSTLLDRKTAKYEHSKRETDIQINTHDVNGAAGQTSMCRSSEHCTSGLNDAKASSTIEKEKVSNGSRIGGNSGNGLCSNPDIDIPRKTGKVAARTTKSKLDKERKIDFDWDDLRKEAYNSGTKNERDSSTMDSVDWEAVRNANVKEISDTIRERGMNNMLAERIKAFLDRLVREHGSIDLEWLRDVPPDKAKDYLLSIRGLGLKSVECVRLLTLHHLAFPVDTNVGRICVRLGWVPLQPLPESLQLHLLELYPMLETIQKYLWPRLCTLDQPTLYELHYQLITFGKVFCTKSKPNCNACPMRGECKHFASAFASARLALPGPEENRLVVSTDPASDSSYNGAIYSTSLPQLEAAPVYQKSYISNNEPVIEEPATPEPESLEYLESAIEDTFYEDPDEIPTIKLNIEQFTQNLQDIMQGNNMELQDVDMSKALVTITPEAASIPQPKLKNISRLRTEHQVYELPDSHPLLEGLDRRETDDPCPYLLAIWTPGETAQSTEPPDASCTYQDMGKLCDRTTCFCCNSIREAQFQKVRGTLLIPCRTAMRGSFPLNGTYFQVNEVFADHSSSLSPIDVPREWIWNLQRRTVYFGTSVPTIFRGLTTEGIQHCFWRGFVCVRGFDQKTRAPRPLLARFHFPLSKIMKNKRTTTEEKK